MQKTVAILGGGISGLSTAHFLSKFARRKGIDVKVHLLEKSTRVGGWMQTVNDGRFKFERGTRSLTAKPHNVGALAELIQDLELTDQLLLLDKKSLVASTRYLMFQGKVTQVPTTPFAALMSPLTRKIPLAVMRDLFQSKRSTTEDESVSDFFRRRFSDDIGRNIMSAFVHGIYGGGDIEQWSLKSLFPRMWQLEHDHRSIGIGSVKAAFSASKKSTESRTELETKLLSSSMFSFKHGCAQLPLKISDKFSQNPKLNVTTGQQVTKIGKDPDGRFRISYGDGMPIIQSDMIVNTLPAPASAKLFPALEPYLEKISLNSVAVVNFGFKKRIDTGCKPSIGFLVPAHEECMATGVIFDHCCFPGRLTKSEDSIITVILGSQYFRKVHGDVTQCSSDKLLSIAEQVLKKHLNIDDKADDVDVVIQKQSFPQYHVGHEENLKAMLKTVGDSYPGLYFTGASCNGVGVPECINNAKKLADTIINTMK